MSRGWFVNAYEIHHWADENPRKAQEELPDLVARLIRASSKPKYFRVLSGDEVTLHGYDMILEVDEGNAFVPAGLSVWEIGTGKNPKKKAEKDYQDRTKNPYGIDIKNTTFVFVTSRKWRDKNEWEIEKNAEGKWKRVRVLDAVDLKEWLHQCSAVHRWFARKIGKRPKGAFDIGQAWDEWRSATEPSSNEDLVIAGRTEEAKKFIQKLKNESPSVIWVFGESRDEAYGFILASIKNAKELIPRVLVINDSKEWMSVVESQNPLILIPRFDDYVNPRLAVKRGHWIIIPESNYQSRNQDNSIELPRPDKQSLVKALVEMGIDEEKAWDTVEKTRGFLTPLRRLLGDFKEPKWAQPENATDHITALLIGAWDGKNDHDVKIVERLVGMSYDEFVEILHKWSVSNDPPVRKVGSVWQIVSRQDMWQLLARFISPRTLEKFGEVAVEVLRELDPRYELKPEERWLAYDKSFKHSKTIRKYIAEMLVILATYGDEDLRNIGMSTVQDKVDLWVSEILKDAAPHRWYSLRDLLPYLAEASPEVFLDAVEESLKGDQPPLMELFVEEGYFGGCPHAGLLWALEGISWNLEYLPRVVLILAKLSRLDPGGRWANRPFKTLREIFLPWHPQTRASVGERLQLLDLILSKEPEVGWKLLLSLIPKGREVSIPIHKPYFRDWAEGWKSKVTIKEYQDYVLKIAEKIQRYSKKNPEKCLYDLVEVLERFPEPIFDSIIEDLKASIDSISPEKRVKVYEKLFEIIYRHKQFPNAKWRLPEEKLKKLEELLQRFTPDDPVNRNKILFDEHSIYIVFQPNLKHEEAERIVEEKCKSALEEIWKEQGIDGITRLIENAKLSEVIGYTLAISSFSNEIEDSILQWIDSENKKFSAVAQSFLRTKLNQDRSYLQTVLEKYESKWNYAKLAKLCLALPLTYEVIELIRKLPPEAEEIYWKNVQHFYLFEGSKELAEWVIRKLLEFDRSVASLNAATHYLNTVAKESGLDADLLAEVLERVATNLKDSEFGQTEIYGIEQIFYYLQHSSEIDSDRLIRLEWLYVPYFWRNQFHIRVKPITLINKVLNDPDLFVQLIRWAYKADSPIEGEFSDLSPEQRKILAKNAYFLLSMIDRLPGQSEEDIDLNKLMEWINRVREKCKHVNRLPICDEKIGEILSHAPVGKDGICPHEAVREAIEKISSKDMERGIEVGIYNQRGVVIKSPDEGGKQERELAKKYNRFANVLRLRYPRTAAMLKRIAQRCIQEARWEDLEIELDDLL